MYTNIDQWIVFNKNNIREEVCLLKKKHCNILNLSRLLSVMTLK